MMKPLSLEFGVLVLVGFLLSGCDSGQYGESTPTDPKSESTLMLTAAPPTASEPSTMDTALLAPAGAAGAAENNEVSPIFNKNIGVLPKNISRKP